MKTTALCMLLGLLATPAAQFTATTLAVARFDASDVYVQSNTWTPGGSTGWHTHPGQSLILVTEGQITEYAAHDPACAPHVFSKGMGIVDSGGDHVHLLRNEGAVVAKTIAVQTIPAGAVRRIDAPAPANCRF